MSTYPLFYLRFLKPPPTDCYVGQHFTIVWTIENDLGDQTYLEPVTVNLSLHTSRVSPGNDDQQLGLRLLNSNESTRTKRKKASPYPPHDKLSSTTATAAKRDITTIFDPFRGGGMVTKLVVEELPLNISHKKEPLPLGTKVAVQLSMALSNLDTNSSHKVWQGAYPLHSNIWIIPAWSIPITATVVKQRHEKAAKSGNQAERVLCIPCDPHRQQLVRIREDAVQSIARHVWDCGMGMCYFLSEYKLDMDNITILELGSGTGLVGIFASLLFKPQKTYLTDLSDALKIMQQNVNLVEKQCNNHTKTVVAELPWGSEKVPEYSRVNLILLADVLYNQSSHDVLLDTLSWLLDNNNCRALLAYKERNPDEREFFDKVASKKWKMTQLKSMRDFMCEIYMIHK